MLKAYKYRLYPTPSQQSHLIQAMGCVRFLYNQALEAKIKHYEQTGKSLSYFDIATGLLLKLKKKHDWLKVPSSQSLQMALRNLDNAFSRFFHKTSAFPKFKAKHYGRQSVQYPQSVRVDWKNNKVYLPKCGEVKIILHRKFEGEIKTCTVSKTPTNKFYISILVEDDKELSTLKSPIKKKTTVGLDLGIKDLVILSNGVKFDNPKYLRKTLKKLKVVQRRFSKKQKGSKNKEKARLKLAKVHEKIANQRKDYLQKVSSSIINNGEIQTVILEDLNISGMTKNHKLALSIADCGWGMFTDMLQYKADRLGKNIIYINRFDPSSKTCSNCGHINKNLTLKDREWTCEGCHIVHDRDVNAAINIKKFGLIKEKLGLGRPVEPVEIPKKRSRKISSQGRIVETGNQ